MAKIHLSLFILAAMGCVLMGSAGAMNHIVGASLGWSVPANHSYYEEWAKPRTFGIGDKLVFMFRTGVHNIIEVNKKEFEACTQSEAIDMMFQGPLIMELNKTGERYFYDGVGTHCEAGTKLGITIKEEAGSAGNLPPGLSKDASSNQTSSASANSLRNISVFSGLLSYLLTLVI